MTAQANYKYDSKSTPNPNHTTPPDGLELIPPADPVSKVKKRLTPPRKSPSLSLPVEADGLPSLASIQMAQKGPPIPKLQKTSRPSLPLPSSRKPKSAVGKTPAEDPNLSSGQESQEEGYAMPPTAEPETQPETQPETDSSSETGAAAPSISPPHRTSTTGSAGLRANSLPHSPPCRGGGLSDRDAQELERFLRPVMDKLTSVRSIQWARMAWKGGGFINPESMPRAIQSHFLALFDQFIRDEDFVYQTLSRLQALRGGFSLSRGTQLVAVAASFGAWFAIDPSLRG